MSSDKLRLFTGIELPARVREGIRRCQRHLPGAHWQSFEQLHLTVNFIGAVDRPLARDIVAQVGGSQCPPFSLILTGAGHFRTRAVWLGVEPSPALADLYTQDREALAALGLPLDERRFRPHVTLARLAKGTEPEAIARYVDEFRNFRCPPFEVTQLALFSSTPQPEGSRYEIIARSGEAC